MSIFEAVVLEAEVNRLRAENETLRDELAQQAEFRRMEREALTGAWNESSRLLRAKNDELRARLLDYQHAAKMDEAPVLRDELQQARARIAELEARLTPIPLSERLPEKGATMLYWDITRRRWLTWFELLRTGDTSEATHWLPMPSAPEDK